MVFKKFQLKIHYIMTCCYMNIPDCSWQVRLHTLIRMYTDKGIVENRIKTLYMIKRIISPLVFQYGNASKQDICESQGSFS